MDDFEKKLLKELYNRGVRYLARDREPSEFYGYLEKPIKGTYYWCGGCALGNVYSLEIFCDLFAEIKWEDDEPFDIGKYLGIVDWTKVPNNARTSRLRKEIIYCDNALGVGGTVEQLEKAIKDYYQYYLNCNNHAIAQNKSSTDAVHSPKHYKLKGLDIESVDVIKATLSDDEYRGWCKGNAMKYLFRAGKKDDELQDLSKCDVYLNWLVDKLKGEV